MSDCIKLYGLSRSGNHCIAEWISSMKNCIIIEEQDTTAVSHIQTIRHSGLWGMCEEDYIILRDYKNFIASIWKRNPKDVVKKTKEWITFAKVFIKKENKIYFNKWFESEDYRKEIAKKLQLEYKDDTLNQIPKIGNWGNGSSFDKHEFDGKAQQMKVNNRFENMPQEFYDIYETTLNPEILYIQHKIDIVIKQDMI